MLTYNEILMVVAMMIALGIVVTCLVALLYDINNKLKRIEKAIKKVVGYSELLPNNHVTRKNRPTNPKTVRKL